MLYVNPLASFRTTPQQPIDQDQKRERMALEEFEHYFLFMLLDEMGKSVPKDGLFPGGPERPIYEEMLNDALSGTMAKSRQLGIADLIERQLDAQQAQAKLTNARDAGDTKTNQVRQAFCR